MSIRVIRRKQVRFRMVKMRSIVQTVVCILAAAGLFRFLVLSDFGSRLDAWMMGAGKNDRFVSAVMHWELSALSDTPPDWADTLTGQSALLSAYEPQVRAAMALAYTDSDREVPAYEAPPSPSAAVPTLTVPLVTGEGFEPPDFLPHMSSPSPSPATSPIPSFPPPGNIQEITFAPQSTDGYDAAQGVFVKNETSLSINVAELLKKSPSVVMSKSGPQIFIVHTHGSEAYTPDAQFPYTPTDVERTEDTQFNVVRIGDEIQKVFEDAGFRVVHDRRIYDEPTYSGSYGRSLNSITSAVKKNPDISVVIDVHRDSIVTADGATTYKTVAKNGDQKTAQVMLVVGTNDSGLNHPNWKQNLTFALHLQKRINAAYPELMRPINLRRERFNAHATNGSLLLEVGSSGNTLGEAIDSAKLFAGEMAAYMKTLKTK